jgi:hypothetical protein
MKIMGEVCLSATGFAGSWRSYASETVENGEDVCAPAASARTDTGNDAETGTRTRRADPEHTCRKADAEDAKPIIVAKYRGT